MIRSYVAAMAVPLAFLLGSYDQYRWPTFGPDAVWSGGWREWLYVGAPLVLLALLASALAGRKP